MNKIDNDVVIKNLMGKLHKALLKKLEYFISEFGTVLFPYLSVFYTILFPYLAQFCFRVWLTYK